jgi:hypothetical protein
MYPKRYSDADILHPFIRMGGGGGGRKIQIPLPEEEPSRRRHPPGRRRLPSPPPPRKPPFEIPPGSSESLIQLSPVTTSHSLIIPATIPLQKLMHKGYSDQYCPFTQFISLARRHSKPSQLAR